REKRRSGRKPRMRWIDVVMASPDAGSAGAPIALSVDAATGRDAEMLSADLAAGEARLGAVNAANNTPAASHAGIENRDMREKPIVGCLIGRIIGSIGSGNGSSSLAVFAGGVVRPALPPCHY